MTFKKSLLGLVAVGLLAMSAAVHSQVSPPQIARLGQTDLMQVIPQGQPSAQSVYAPVPRVTNTYGYYKSGANASSGSTYTFGTDVTYAMMQNSGTITHLYFTLASAPSDGAMNCIFNIGQITFAYVAANTGQSINNAVTTLAANAQTCYLYSRSNATWDRVQ